MSVEKVNYKEETRHSSGANPRTSTKTENKGASCALSACRASVMYIKVHALALVLESVAIYNPSSRFSEPLFEERHRLESQALSLYKLYALSPLILR